MARQPSGNETGTDRRHEGVTRRAVLRASAAGAGATVVAGNAAAIGSNPAVGTIRFGDVGVEYEFAGDVRPKRVDDCVHPQYDVADGRVVFYTDVLHDEQLTSIRRADAVVAGLSPATLPAEAVTVMDGGFLPTTLGDALHPRRGVLVEQSFSPPAPDVVRAGEDLLVRTRGPAVRVAPGETETVELAPTEVEARKYERRPTEGTSEKVPGKTVASGATYVPTTVALEATPTLTVRNHGEVTVHRAANRTEAGE